MNKTLLFFFVILLIATTLGLDLNCPVSSKVTSCSPKCKDDHDCLGQKCCPNICNMKSCVQSDKYNSQDNGYKSNIKTGTGSYCGNVKCNSYEKCDIDRSTKRPKCIRQ